MTTFERLFEPIDIGGLQVKNRIVFPAHGPRISGQRYLRYLEERLKNGVGLVVVGGIDVQGCGVARVGAPFAPGEADSMYPDPTTEEGAAELDRLLIPEMRAQAAVARRHGAVIFRQLVHSGGYATRHDLRPGISASPVPDEMLGETPHALSVTEIHRFAAAYGRAAARAREGGFDGVEIHACHGLLINSFLSPLTNIRTDEYGGSLENRTRFLREILESIRSSAGGDFPVGVRLPGDERLEGGADAKEMAEMAVSLSPFLSYVSVAGASEGGRKGGVTVPAVMSADFPQAVYAESAGVLRSALDIPVILTGRVTTPEVAERVLRDGQADMVGMVRALLADPEWVTKVKSADIASLRLCTGDNEGCRQRTQFRTRGGGMSVACTVNAAAGRESEFDIEPAAEPRRVVVVGGGPAGMEAARVAHLSGHSVTLLEQDAELGGQVRVAALDPRGASLEEAIRYLTRQLQRLNVDVRLNTEATPDLVEGLGADAVIVATGATPARPRFTVHDPGFAVTAADVLTGRVQPGRVVCVVAGFDGHRAPGTLAELLAERGHEVHLLTERMFIGESQDPGSNHQLQKRLIEKGVRVSPLTGVASAGAREVRTFHSLTRAEAVITDVDTVVHVGRTAADGLLHDLEARAGGVRVIAAGDCVAPRRILNAILEGARAGAACGQRAPHHL
jgi:2,4-dienoyl-CoA reductase-like NADH-dependent reductase (Old Yellow Enzyme family)/NADPH-dependent 2,4-dienoyl-CoA reductase/sulfur reductase-like enzyme